MIVKAGPELVNERIDSTFIATYSTNIEHHTWRINLHSCTSRPRVANKQECRFKVPIFLYEPCLTDMRLFSGARNNFLGRSGVLLVHDVNQKTPSPRDTIAQYAIGVCQIAAAFLVTTPRLLIWVVIATGIVGLGGYLSSWFNACQANIPRGSSFQSDAHAI